MIELISASGVLLLSIVILLAMAMLSIEEFNL